ncbi:unnamed protein product [Parajaminaea phylloscopi]
MAAMEEEWPLDPAAGSSSPRLPVSSPPQTGDASFGLDPSADVEHHVEGHRWLPEFDWVAPRLSARSIRAGSTSSRAASRQSTGKGHRSRVEQHAGEAPVEKAKPDESGVKEQPRPGTMPTRPPTGSLTLSIFSPGISLTRRAALLASSITVNAALPFLNGIMLGTGEIVARALIVPVLFIGWTWARQKYSN